MTTTYRTGDRITVRDIFGKQWPALYRGPAGSHDSNGVLFEINGHTSRTEKHKISKV